MSIIRNIISDIRGTAKLLSSDNLISDRVVLGEMKGAASMLIKQQIDKRKLFNSPNIFTNITCLEMQEVPIGECCEYTSQFMIAKSVLPIPRIAESIYGLLVQKCTSIDNLVSFKETTPRRFSNLLKLNLPKKDIYFWVENGHLYITNSNIKRVNISAFFEEDVPYTILCPQDCDCKSNNNCDPCVNPLDLEFKCPGFLENTVKDMVYKKLLSVYFNVPSEGNKTSNNMDETTK